MLFKKGTTLIELLIYTAILAAVSVFMISSILITIKSFNDYRLSRNISVSAASAMERMVREVRQASDVSGAGVFDVSPGHLVLDTAEFFADSGRLVIKNAGGNTYLTPQDLIVSNLIFREVATSTNQVSKAVKIEMELTGGQGSYAKSEKFQTTVVLRGSYK